MRAPTAHRRRPVAPEINVDKRSAEISGHKLIGYVRVSADGPNSSQQIDTLRRAGVDRRDIHLDVTAGVESAGPGLRRVLSLLRADDTLAITRLDRLSCSVVHLVALGASLRERGIGLHVIEQGIDTSTAEGHAMCGMLSVLAELQRGLMAPGDPDGPAGTRCGARARGRNGGRRPRLTPDQAALAQRLYDARDKTVQQIADIFDVPRSTVYGYLQQGRTVLRPREP